MTGPIDHLLISGDRTIRDAVACIDEGRAGIALVVDDERRLCGTVTDGDVRRAMLASIDLDARVELLLERQRSLDEQRPMPLTAPVGMAAADLIALMRRFEVRQIPLIDDTGRPLDVALLHELIEAEDPPLRAVVMAGGFGTRLGELTRTTPKPMLPIGDRPLLERIIDQLRAAGIRHVNLTTHYRADDIAQHFGDGSRFGVEIAYVSEERPLGTAGALGCVDGDGPLLVMNGDILTALDFRAMHAYHVEHGADMTVALRPYELRVPYGMVDLDGERIRGIREKPLVSGFVNAGIYLLDATVCRLVPPGKPFQMPDLIGRVLEQGGSAVGFPLREYWTDIGRLPDYERALEDAERLP